MAFLLQEELRRFVGEYEQNALQNTEDNRDTYDVQKQSIE